MNKYVFPCAILVAMLAAGSVASPSESDLPATDGEALARWQAMRFGMFIHWGPVSLKGTEIGWSRKGPRRGRSDTSTGHIPMAEYDTLYQRFNPVAFDADEWVRIARDAGMQYMVFTSKHHDGFSMFHTEQSEYSIEHSPFRRDVCQELADACHRAGLGLGWYYSPRDWYHPDFATDHHSRYIAFYLGQLRELCTHYGRLDILWFDGLDSPRELWGDTPGESFRLIRSLQPHIVLNNRGGLPGDFDTPEQRVGTFNNRRPWETCMTLCRQWAWKPDDKMKSLEECIRTLATCVGGDGNLLFNVGPMPSGAIEPRQVERLREMGAWITRHGESIYGTRGGPFTPCRLGASTHRGDTVYVHAFVWDADRFVLPAIDRRVVSAKLLSGGGVHMTQDAESIVLTVPENDRDPIDTVVVLELDGDAGSVRPLPISQSLTFGKRVRVSNVYQNVQHYAGASAVDGDGHTRWATDAGTHAAWIEIDLGAEATFTNVMIDEAIEQRIQSFELQVRRGDGWHTIHRGATVGRNWTQSFASVTARYVRLNILDAVKGPTIWEIEVHPGKR